LQTKAARTTPSTLSAPEALSAAAGDHEGEINLTWKKVENSRSYIIQISPDPLWLVSHVPKLNSKEEVPSQSSETDARGLFKSTLNEQTGQRPSAVQGGSTSTLVCLFAARVKTNLSYNNGEVQGARKGNE